MNSDICILKNKGSCGALTVNRCVVGICKFYTNKEDANQKTEKVNRRLRSLDEVEQKSIAEKYCGGRMPWAVGASNGSNV